MVPVAREWMARLAVGDQVHLTDARGARRRLRVVAAEPDARLLETERTVYFATGLALTHVGAARRRRKGAVGELPARSQPILLAPCDRLVLTRALDPGHPAVRDEGGGVVAPARIGCTLPEVFGHL